MFGRRGMKDRLRQSWILRLAWRDGSSLEYVTMALNIRVSCWSVLVGCLRNARRLTLTNPFIPDKHVRFLVILRQGDITCCPAQKVG